MNGNKRLICNKQERQEKLKEVVTNYLDNGTIETKQLGYNIKELDGEVVVEFDRLSFNYLDELALDGEEVILVINGKEYYCYLLKMYN